MTQNKDANWYSPICDIVLRKVALWQVSYHKGDPSADRPFMLMNGRIADRVTRYANPVRFTISELDHLVRLIDAAASEDPLSTGRILVKHFQSVRSNIKNGKLLPGGEYEIVLDDYLEDVNEVLQLLLNVRDGTIQSVSDIVSERIDSGKSPFEM